MPDENQALDDVLDQVTGGQPIVASAPAPNVRPPASRPEAVPANANDIDIADIPRRALVSEVLRRRLQKFINFSSDKDNTYSVTKLPANLTWGPAGGPNANNVCRAGTNIPVVVWHVGEVMRFWFFKQNGEPADNVSLTVAPFTANAKAAVQAVAKKFLDPRRRVAIESFTTEVKASKWQTARVPGERAVMAVPFDRVYDASERYMRLSDMPTVDASKIKAGDLVLLETYISRYVDKTDKMYRQVYTMRAISLLLSGFSKADASYDEDVDSGFDAVL
ncbi:hypothetical protein FA95DRAFT_1611822 [Auriscalpium vulgare]|uniref:Uncharacterized protein n=1 Tax=Auriscalpium vulgare TaxID=40419 RepID=A0ACB8R8P4_9AGAM|nr:hypothetical protein FA95DRAFT_1611822 [Auriscalpium vulgare]